MGIPARDYKWPDAPAATFGLLGNSMAGNVVATLVGGLLTRAGVKGAKDTWEPTPAEERIEPASALGEGGCSAGLAADASRAAEVPGGGSADAGRPLEDEVAKEETHRTSYLKGGRDIKVLKSQLCNVTCLQCSVAYFPEATGKS